MVDKDGFKYYAYILVYVDDIVMIVKEPGPYIEITKKIYQLSRQVLEDQKTI